MTDVTTNAHEKYLQRRGRIMAIGLILVVSLPMILAYVLYQTGFGVPEGSTNKGDLLSPAQAFSGWHPETQKGAAWNVEDDKQKRWRLIVPVDRECTGYCEQNLYLTRQVHIRLAKEAYRVERVVLLMDGALSSDRTEWLDQEHPGVQVLRPDTVAMMASLAETNLPGDPLETGRYFVMDQDGFVMMGYTPEHTGGELLDDIKRLLRYSYEN